MVTLAVVGEITVIFVTSSVTVADDTVVTAFTVNVTTFVVWLTAVTVVVWTTPAAPAPAMLRVSPIVMPSVLATVRRLVAAVMEPVVTELVIALMLGTALGTSSGEEPSETSPGTARVPPPQLRKKVVAVDVIRKNLAPVGIVSVFGVAAAKVLALTVSEMMYASPVGSPNWSANIVYLFINLF